MARLTQGSLAFRLSCPHPARPICSRRALTSTPAVVGPHACSRPSSLQTLILSRAWEVFIPGGGAIPYTTDRATTTPRTRRQAEARAVRANCTTEAMERRLQSASLRSLQGRDVYT